MKFYPKVKKFVNDAFKKTGDDHGIKHFERTVYWLKQLKPDADEAFLIAAYSHDVERAMREQAMWQRQKDSSRGFRDQTFLQLHQERGADIMRKFLHANGADELLTEKVHHLISKHEVGGDEDQNLLKDVDSVSFFENNIGHFVTKKVAELNREKVKSKFDWMYNRITSDKARAIAKTWYEQAIKDLGY